VVYAALTNGGPETEKDRWINSYDKGEYCQSFPWGEGSFTNIVVLSQVRISHRDWDKTERLEIREEIGPGGKEKILCWGCNQSSSSEVGIIEEGGQLRVRKGGTKVIGVKGKTTYAFSMGMVFTTSVSGDRGVPWGKYDCRNWGFQMEKRPRGRKGSAL